MFIICGVFLNIILITIFTYSGKTPTNSSGEARGAKDGGKILH
jgi:hypothetical protein